MARWRASSCDDSLAAAGASASATRPSAPASELSAVTGAVSGKLMSTSRNPSDRGKGQSSGRMAQGHVQCASCGRLSQTFVTSGRGGSSDATCMTSVLHAPYFIARHQLPDLNLRTRFFLWTTATPNAASSGLCHNARLAAFSPWPFGGQRRCFIVCISPIFQGLLNDPMAAPLTPRACCGPPFLQAFPYVSHTRVAACDARRWMCFRHPGALFQHALLKWFVLCTAACRGLFACPGGF